MTAPTTTPSPADVDLIGEPLPATCVVCPHPDATHDRIGRRFCDATLTGALARGCVCRS